MTPSSGSRSMPCGWPRSAGVSYREDRRGYGTDGARRHGGGWDDPGRQPSQGIELLRTQQAGLWTAADLAEYLGQIVEQKEKHDGVPARPHEAPAVRIMNLHKVKGLEAPAVFLVDPAGESDHDVDLHIDRSGDNVRGYLAIFGEAQGWQSPPLVAHPQGWDTLATEERDSGTRRISVCSTWPQPVPARCSRSRNAARAILGTLGSSSSNTSVIARCWKSQVSELPNRLSP